MRNVRKRVSSIQILLYPPLAGFMYSWTWLLQRFLKYDRRGPMFDYIREGKPFIFALWHEDTLPTAMEYVRYSKQFPTIAMVSPGKFGVILTFLLGHYRIPVVQGSNSLRGVEAVREITDRVNRGDLSVLIMADGSRGPSRKAQWGAVHLAKHTGIPIIACRGWTQHQIILEKTWMKVALPLPWGRGVFLSSDPLFVPSKATKAELTEYRAKLEEMMNEQADASVAYFEEGPEAVAAWGKAGFGP